MSRALALAVGVVVFHRVLAGAEADLGSAVLPACTALLLAAVALGILRSGRLPALAERLALSLLVPLRGPLCDLGQWLLPHGAAANVGSALLSLLPLGVSLGAMLGTLPRATVPTLLAGLVLGEAAVLTGATGFLPVWLAGVAAAAFIAALRELELPTEGLEPPPLPVVDRLAALLLGAALGLLLWVLARVTPGYATPGPGFESTVAIALLAPAALVAWPAMLLAREGWPRRALGVAGGVLLAIAAVRTLTHLDIYENSVAQVDMTMQRHAAALSVVDRLPLDMARAAHRLPLDAWSWLLLFVGVLAATAGLALGARRGRELVFVLFGGALAALAPCALRAWPTSAPAAFVLVAGSLAIGCAALALLGRRAWWLAPLLALPWFAWDGGPQLRLLPGFDEMRRPGEFGVDAFARSPAADSVLFLAPGRNARAIVGAQAHAMAFTGDTPAFGFDAQGEPLARFVPAPPTPPDAAPAAEPKIEYSRGLRVAGIPLHAGHAPLGPEGSTGRMLRLFARRGPAFVTGVGAELLAADLHDAALGVGATVSSPTPLGTRLLAVLLEDCGSGGWQPSEVLDPEAAARDAESGSFATVIVAPAPRSMPEASALLTEERLARLCKLLTRDGRCLAWVDTTDLSSSALGARLAAFGKAFGGRAAAFVEPRELDAPFVLLLGWASDAGAPTAAELAARLPGPDTTGWRVPLASPADLSSLLVRDGEGLIALAPGPLHARGRPVDGSVFATGGWDAVAPLVDPEARLSRAVAGAPDGPRPARDLLDGLALHATYDYHLENLNETALEIPLDIDWDSWEQEVACYERAAKAQPDSPLLHHALAALLEPLAIDGDWGRFAQVWKRCDAGKMSSWRLALQEWWVEKGSLETDAAKDAAERAKQLRGAH